MTTLPPDPTLDEVRAALAPLLPRQAAFDGWNARAIASAAAQLGVDADMAALAFPGGATDMIDAWFAWVDAQMAQALPAEHLAQMKIRARILALVEKRLELLAPEREALRRALAILAIPTNLRLSTRLGWRAADHMWRLAGDSATDYNHYTKRTLLAGIYAATLLVFLDDESEGHADTRAFLGRRIDGVMRFEAAKARMIPHADRRLSLSRFIGRLRYPAI